MTHRPNRRRPYRRPGVNQSAIQTVVGCTIYVIILIVVGLAVFWIVSSVFDTDAPAESEDTASTVKQPSVPTATPTPTDTPVPTATHVPLPTPIVGLGVSRRKIQSLFEHPRVGLVFSSAPYMDGTPRTFGLSPDERIALDIVGPNVNVSEMTMLVALSPDAPNVIPSDSAHMLTLLNHTFPDWEGGSKWFNESLKNLPHTKESRTIYRNADVELMLLPLIPETEVLMLLISNYK